MKVSGWHEAFQALLAKGADTLTEQERQLRRLPMADVKTLEAVFQPRQFDESTSESGKHLDVLKRALQPGIELDPITVFKVGGEWLCVDGHHRLEAYRQVGGKRTHVPVKVFEGSVEDAFRFCIEANAPDKLNLTREDKLEAAWKMVLLVPAYTYREISRATTAALGTVHNMARALKDAQKRFPTAAVEGWTWRQVKELVGRGQDTNNMWQTMKAKEIAKQLAKSFCGLPKQHPRVFAMGLCRYDPEAALAIAEEVTRQVAQAGSREQEQPDF